ncbi:MAG TPA: pyridoxal-dependent decarboxylase [Paracoccaceae bacterium]|nr:pyridoxal-dependent decarboxylase [Paracoccaceae bacterium]
MAGHETLDPEDWSGMRALGHRIMDEAIDHLAGLRDRPVWQDMPAEVRAAFGGPLPREGIGAEASYAAMVSTVRPYPMGNIHPRFWAWYMGAGNIVGALGDFLAAIDGSNLGGGNIAPALLERQVIRWMAEIVGFPETAGGTLTSGGSVANLIGLTVARNVKAGHDVRADGLGGARLRYYASDQVHSCHTKAMEILGLGHKALRLIPADADGRLPLAELAQAVAEDRVVGIRPVAVIGSAGTVNTGAFDNLDALADFCAAEDLWFHVDGCIGAVLKLSPAHSTMANGLERADSVALDPHKWLHAPFEAGCALVRDRGQQYATFALHPEYLEEKPRGVAGAEYLFDYGIDLSRGFKALKVWMALSAFGADKFGRLIDQNIGQCQRLAARIRAEPMLELMAPVTINIVCFRYRPPGVDEAQLKEINSEIMFRLQEAGVAVPTDTMLRGRHSLRVAVVNHRTRDEDLDLLVAEVLRLGAEVMAAREPVA